MALAPLLITAALIFSFLVLYSMAQTSNALGTAMVEIVKHSVGRIIFIGRYISAGVEWASNAISHYLGLAAAKMEHHVGTWFHTLAHVATETAAKIEAAMQLSFALSAALASLADWHNVLKLYHSLVGQDRATVEKLRRHEKAISQAKVGAAHAQAQANTAASRAQAIPADVTLPWRIPLPAAAAKSIAIPADVVIPRDLAPIRERLKTVEDTLHDLWKRARGIAIPSIAGIGLGALTFALGRLGIGWARCSKVGKVGRNVCGMDSSLLEALLADTLAIVGAISIVELAHELQGVMPEVTAVVRAGIREAHAADAKIKAIA